MTIKIVLLLSGLLFASTVQVPDLGVNVDVPEGWVGAKSDDSTYVVTNWDGSVQYGVTMFSGLAPYDSDSAWVSGTTLGFKILLEAEPAVIWSTDSLSPMSGLFTYRVNYETFYQPTGDVLAGQSRFLARNGIGYEIWVIGDTLELYTNFNPYDSLLNLVSFFNLTSIKKITQPNSNFGIRSGGLNTWILPPEAKAMGVAVYSINGKQYSTDVHETNLGTVIEVSGAPGLAVIQMGKQRRVVRLK